MSRWNIFILWRRVQCIELCCKVYDYQKTKEYNEKWREIMKLYQEHNFESVIMHSYIICLAYACLQKTGFFKNSRKDTQHIKYTIHWFNFLLRFAKIKYRGYILLHSSMLDYKQKQIRCDQKTSTNSNIFFFWFLHSILFFHQKKKKTRFTLIFWVIIMLQFSILISSVCVFFLGNSLLNILLICSMLAVKLYYIETCFKRI